MENKLIYNKLKSVPKEYLKTIQAGRLKGMSDIKPQWRIERMTEVFGVCGFGWKVANLRFDYKNGSDNQIVCFCYLELFIKQNDVWSDSIPGVGGSSFIANERNGLYTSDEAGKMAYTDALSVAMKMLGMASDVYMGHGGKYETAPQQPTQTTTKPDLIAGTENCQKVITYLAGGGSIQEVQKKYNISETLLKELTK
jgi:hypothetical protein